MVHDPTSGAHAFSGPPSEHMMRGSLVALREAIHCMANAGPWTAHQAALLTAVRQLWQISEFLLYQYDNDPVRRTLQRMENTQ